MKKKKIDGITIIFLFILLILFGAPLWACLIIGFALGAYNKIASENDGKDSDSTGNA